MRRDPRLIFFAVIAVIALIAWLYFAYADLHRQPSEQTPPSPTAAAVSPTPSAEPTDVTSDPSPDTTLPPSVPLGPRTKKAGCNGVESGRPDSACTPGAVFEGITAAEVCVDGYAKDKRKVASRDWNGAFTEYGVTEHSVDTFEVDHLVSLELGGSNDIANLWPERQPGAKTKDKLENQLHDQVCAGQITLIEAQQKIAHFWLSLKTG